MPVEMTVFWLFQFDGELVIRFHLYARRDDAVEVAS